MSQIVRRSITLATLPNACVTYPCANSRLNARPLVISGTRDLTQCSTLTVTITYYDVNGDVIAASTEGPNPPSTTDGEFWDYNATAPAGASSCTVEIFCGGVLVETVPNVGLAPAGVVTSFPSTPSGPVLTAGKTDVGGNKNLVININNPNADKDDDSDVLVIQHHVGHGQYFSYPHDFTENPGTGRREITYWCMAPGRYSTKLVFIHGSRPVEIYSAPLVKIP